MNKLLIIVMIVLLISCREREDQIKVLLEPEYGCGMFLPGDKILWPINYPLQFKGVPQDIKEYVVRSLLLQNEQHYFYLYKSGILGKDEYTNILSQFGSDTSKFTSDFIDDEVLILTGTNSNGKRVIIVDSENSNDFTEDKIIEYDYPISIERQKQIDSLLPIVSAKYDCYYNGKKITKMVSIKPSLYYRSLKINLPTDNEIEKKYFLFVSVPEYRKGTLKVDDNKYNVCVSNHFSSTTYSKQNTKMFIFDPKNKNPSETDGEIPFKTGEIFNANGKDFLIQSISTWGDTLHLKYVGKNVHPVGYN